MEKTPVSVNINFDSLNEAFGFPEGFRDPSFFSAFDRFQLLCAKYGIKLTLYIIAKDLESDGVAARIREWSQDGHEIGNHSWSHPMNLGALPLLELQDQIKRAHEALSECTGKPVAGFTAPAWATSKAVVNTLIDLGYAYDASVFPSAMLYPVICKVAVNHIRTPKSFYRALDRKDWTVPLSKPRTPFFTNRNFDVLDVKPEKDGLTVLPLPTSGRFSLALWHTVGFLLGWDGYVKRVGHALKTHPHFYHLMHPADYTSVEDLSEKFVHGLERLEAPLDLKMARIEQIFEMIRSSGRPVKTMVELARDFESKSIIVKSAA